MHEIVKNDEYNFKSKSKFCALMNDGVETKYIALNPNDDYIRGINLDQLILVDDYRWKILNKHYDYINQCIKPCLCRSCVPEEFQIQEYKW